MHQREILDKRQLSWYETGAREFGMERAFQRTDASEKLGTWGLVGTLTWGGAKQDE
jgi:hypothetical protein